MRFSLDGWHLLGGVGASGVFLDGRQIAERAGGWDWLDSQTVMGPGDYDGPMPGFYRYPLPSGPQQYLNALLATNFYGNGIGSWVRYLADGVTGSSDSAGNQWADRVALGFEGVYQVFTDQSWVPLIFRDITTGVETIRPNPGEWEVLPDGTTYFSRNFRGIFFADVFWACGYQAAYGGLCIWRPFAQSEPTYFLSTDLDFNPDISKRPNGSDSLLLVGSGQNQGETAQHLYEIDLSLMQFCRDGGTWQKLYPAAPATKPPEPIVVIGRNIFAGWFTGADRSGLPGNSYLQAWQGADPFVRTNDGTVVARFISASSDSDLDELNRRCAEWDAANPTIPSLGYWTRKAQALGVCTAKYPGIEAYCHAGEDLGAFEADMRAQMARVPHGWLIAQCYTSNYGNTTDLEALVPVYARILRDMGDGVLSFSGTDAARGRATGYFDHPEVHDEWTELMAGIPGAPAVVVPPEPVEPPIIPPEPPIVPVEPPIVPPEPPIIGPIEPPEPPIVAPIPPIPIPVPPEPEPEEPMAIAIGQKGQFRPYGTKGAWTKGIVCCHQDEELYEGKPVIFSISTDLDVDPVSTDPGHLCAWLGGGKFEANRASAGGAERTSFDGRNLMVGRPDELADVFEWVNLT